LFNEAGLLRLMARCCSYYERSRTHLALDKDTPIPRLVTPPANGTIVAIPEVGGLHHRYERRAGLNASHRDAYSRRAPARHCPAAATTCPAVGRRVEVSAVARPSPRHLPEQGSDNGRDDISVLTGTTNYRTLALRSSCDVLMRDQMDFLVGTGTQGRYDVERVHPSD
jgi:hypothetical protein